MHAGEKRLTGRIAREKIRHMSVPRPPDGVVARFMALGDPCGVVSDAMDELGVPPGVIGASVLRPTIAGRDDRWTGADAAQYPATGQSARRRQEPMPTRWPSSRRTISPRPATCW